MAPERSGALVCSCHDRPQPFSSSYTAWIYWETKSTPMKKPRSMMLGTRCVHAGEERHGQTASLTTDIARTAVFVLPNVRELRRINSGRSHAYYYSRSGNPTVTAAEKKINALEDGAGCVATASGMAAILAGVLA